MNKASEPVLATSTIAEAEEDEYQLKQKVASSPFPQQPEPKVEQPEFTKLTTIETAKEPEIPSTPTVEIESKTKPENKD